MRKGISHRLSQHRRLCTQIFSNLAGSHSTICLLTSWLLCVQKGNVCGGELSKHGATSDRATLDVEGRKGRQTNE